MRPVARDVVGGAGGLGQAGRPTEGLRLFQSAPEENAADTAPDMPAAGVGGEVSASRPDAGFSAEARELCRELIRTAYPELQRRAEGGEERVRPWLARLLDLGELLGVRVPSSE